MTILITIATSNIMIIAWYTQTAKLARIHQEFFYIGRSICSYLNYVISPQFNRVYREALENNISLEFDQLYDSCQQPIKAQTIITARDDALDIMIILTMNYHALTIKTTMRLIKKNGVYVYLHVGPWHYNS